jgi:hypothetical protein
VADSALSALIIVALGLCAVAVMALYMTKPIEQAIIKAVFWVLVGVLFGAIIVLAAMERLVIGR